MGYYEKALEIQDAIGDRGEQIIILNNLVNVYTALERREQARAALRRAASLREEVADPEGAALLWIELGDRLLEDGLLDDGLLDGGAGNPRREYERAARICEEHGDMRGLALAEMHIARSWSRENQHAISFRHGERALALRIDVGNDKETVAAMGNLALIYDAAGEVQKSLALMERALDIAERCIDIDGMRALLKNLGASCMDADLDEAGIGFYSRALALAEDANDHMESASILESLGLLHVAVGRRSEGLALMRRALLIYSDMNAADEAEKVLERLRALDDA